MASDFSIALARTLNELKTTQSAFANSVGLSHSLITKLLAGEEAHRNTYLKIFSHLHDRPEGKALARALMEAYLRDVARDIGMEDEYQQAELTVSTRREAAIAHIFHGIPEIILAAFYAVGEVAKRNDLVFNGLMNLAEIAVGADAQPGTTFPKNHFSAALRKPAASRRVLGGSLGDLFSKIGGSEEE